MLLTITRPDVLDVQEAASSSAQPTVVGGVVVDDDNDGIGTSNNEHFETIVTQAEAAADSHDEFNKPRHRRKLILQSLAERHGGMMCPTAYPLEAEADLSGYRNIHDEKMLDFLSTAWGKWVELGKDGRDSSASSQTGYSANGGGDDGDAIPGLIPINFALHRDGRERPGTSVYGGMSYYCTDMCTPIEAPLLEELRWDGAVISMAVHRAVEGVKIEDGGEGADAHARQPLQATYALTTHPGHHAAKESFGGYCYVNHAARAAREMQALLGKDSKVAILDVDYHCGNGTASLFYTDATVWVTSIHCDPNFDYPFNAGFADQIGDGDGWGSTMHMPLPPGTTWEGEDGYREALSVAMDAIITGFQAEGLVISLGLDTHEGDQVAIRRAGFHLSGDDYVKMGRLIGTKVPLGIPCIFVQEGGYKMDTIGQAASDVVVSFCQARVDALENTSNGSI